MEMGRESYISNFALVHLLLQSKSSEVVGTPYVYLVLKLFPFNLSKPPLDNLREVLNSCNSASVVAKEATLLKTRQDVIRIRLLVIAFPKAR